MLLNIAVSLNFVDFGYGLANFSKFCTFRKFRNFRNFVTFDGPSLPENYEIYDNSPHHLQNQRNIFRGLQGRPIESNENYEI